MKHELLAANQKGSIIAELIRFILAAIAVVLIVLFIKNPAKFLIPCGNFLIQNEVPQTSDAIVILLGSDPGRLGTAYKLYQNNLAPRLVFGTGYVNREALQSLPQNFKWPSPSEAYLIGLESLGVPRGIIETVDTSNNVDTAAELSSIVKAARAKGWKRLILVSSAAHTKRVKLIWSRVAPDLPATVVAARPEEMERWWLKEPMIRSVGYEYGALVKEYGRRLYNAVDSSL